MSSRTRPAPMRHAQPGRRLGRVSGRNLLADRLRDELSEEITSSQLQPGTKLPTEGELAKRFNVSRATVRDAVRALIEAGYVTRRRGSGSYVAERRRMPHGLDSTLSYLAMIESAGVRAGMRVLEAAFEESLKDDSPLQLSPGDTVLAVERVRTADDRPVIYSHDRIPARLLRTDLDLQNLHPSLFALLKSSGMRRTTPGDVARRRRHRPCRGNARYPAREASVVHRGDRLRPGRDSGHAVPGMARFRSLRCPGQPEGRHARRVQVRDPRRRRRRSSDHGRTGRQADD